MRRYLAVGFFLIVLGQVTSGYAQEAGLKNDQDMDWQNDAEAILHRAPTSPLQAAIDADHARLEQQRRALTEDKLHHVNKTILKADEAAIKADEQKLKADQKACSEAAMKAADGATPPSSSSPNPAVCRY